MNLSLDIWTGGAMRPVDALDKLRADGFPVEDVAVEFNFPPPRYERKVGESGEIAQSRYDNAMRVYLGEKRGAMLQKAGEAVIRLIAAHAAIHAVNVEWRGEKGNERAVLKLAEDYGVKVSSEVNGMAYVLGPWEMLADVAKQGVHHQPGAIRRETLPGVSVRAYMAFMSTTLALCPQPGVRYPVIVAHDAYAVCLVGNTDDDRVSVGIMPKRERVGVVGASAEQVMADLKATIEAEAAGEKPISFDPNDFKTRLRLRRKLAGGGDNG